MQRQSQTLSIENHYVLVGQQPTVPVTPKRIVFGDYLRRERLLREISVDELIEVTRVRGSHFEALENNNFEALPPKTFVIGFLRSMSKHMGLNEDDVINRFLVDLEAFESNKKLSVDQSQDQSKTKEHRVRFKMLCGVMGLVALLFLILLPYLLRVFF